MKRSIKVAPAVSLGSNQVEQNHEAIFKQLPLRESQIINKANNEEPMEMEFSSVPP
jgi:hypothetical protein